MEKTLTAILLKATDKGESDKAVRLFSAEEGVVDATMKGVRKAKAKLKFASQPFAFCSYELTEKGGRYTVTGASSIEDTYSLCSEPTLYATSAVVLELIEKSSLSIDSKNAFIVLVKTLKSLLVYPQNASVTLAKFIQKILSLSGFVLSPEKREVEPNTVDNFLTFIARKTLDETAEYSFDEGIVKRSVYYLLNRFESVYETTLTSKKVYKDLTD